MTQRWRGKGQGSPRISPPGRGQGLARRSKCKARCACVRWCAWGEQTVAWPPSRLLAGDTVFARLPWDPVLRVWRPVCCHDFDTPRLCCCVSVPAPGRLTHVLRKGIASAEEPGACAGRGVGWGGAGPSSREGERQPRLESQSGDEGERAWRRHDEDVLGVAQDGVVEEDAEEHDRQRDDLAQLVRRRQPSPPPAPLRLRLRHCGRSGEPGWSRPRVQRRPEREWSRREGGGGQPRPHAAAVPRYAGGEAQ